MYASVTPESVAVRLGSRVGRQLVPRIERERRRAAAQQEAHPVVLLLLDRPPEPLGVELSRARKILDAEREDADVRLHAATVSLRDVPFDAVTKPTPPA
jgi:hypothetical protein